MTAVLCRGLATRDTIWRVPELPRADGRVVAHERVVAGGGPAATAAVTLARLGIDVEFSGAVGDDAAGAFVLDSLVREGVGVKSLQIVPGAVTAESAVLVAPDGSRTIVHHPGTAGMPPPEHGDAEWVHVDHLGYPAEGRQLSIDGGNPIDGLDLEGVDLYAPTEGALRAAFGDAQAALAAGAALVVVTHGQEGCTAHTADGGFVDVPASPVAVVSTLGAGDVFHGALLAFFVRGAPLEQSLRAANTAAALSCRALDARSAIPTLDELERSLA